MHCLFPLDALLLEGGAQGYEYLNKSRREIDGVDDREEWRLLKVGESVLSVFSLAFDDLCINYYCI